MNFACEHSTPQKEESTYIIPHFTENDKSIHNIYNVFTPFFACFVPFFRGKCPKSPR